MKHESVGAEVLVDGRTLSLTNLTKPFYPEADFSKAAVLEYYRRIAPVLLPHTRGRPLSMKRYPHGSGPEFFFEKQCPDYAPDWIRTFPIPSRGREKPIDYILLDDLPTLMWTANLSNLEVHTFLHRATDTTTPTSMVFDMDPGEGATLFDCARVGLRLKGLFDALGLSCYPKTSGSAGLHVHVPLNTPVSYEDTKTFSRAVAQTLERDDPKAVTSNMSKAKRVGKVFIDWSQNDDHKTTVCVYSLRARPTPTVSTPLHWREVEAAVAREDTAGIVFEAADVLARVEREGDIYAPVLSQKQTLPAMGQ